jgi:GNAT superfamily N-acetyltransferase
VATRSLGARGARLRYAPLVQIEQAAVADYEAVRALDLTLVGVRDRAEALIVLLVVHPKRRRSGVASALIRAIEARSPTSKLFTSTNESNTVMQAVCEALGFVRSGIVENLDEGDPEIIYFKRLR